MSNTPTVSPEDWAVWRDYFRGNRELVAALDRRLADDAGISHPDYLVLLSLWEAPDNMLRTGELAERLSWEKSRLSHHATRMQTRGLIERRECETDARGVWIALTADGRRTFLQATRDHTVAIREWFFDILSDEEKQVLGTVARRMRERLGTACAAAETPTTPPAPPATPAPDA